MTRYFLASALVMLLASCASVDDLRTKDPVFFSTTEKSSQEYGDCLINNWRGLGENVMSRQIRNGLDVYTQGRSNVDEVVRVQHYDSKTHVTMYARTQYGFQDMMQAANLCLR